MMVFNKNIKLSIIGTRGIPASYGGFETSVEETGKRFVKKGIKTDIYCRTNHYKKKLNSHKNSNLIYVWSPRSKYLDTIISTFLSILILIRNQSDIVIMYGVGNSLLIPILKIFQIPVISVVDGADWERNKWGYFSKLYLRVNSFFAVKFAETVIVDSMIVKLKYKNKYNYNCKYIQYGFTSFNKYNKKILFVYFLLKMRIILLIF